MKAKLDDVIQVTTVDRKSKIISIAEILELVPNPHKTAQAKPKMVPKSNGKKEK